MHWNNGKEALQEEKSRISEYLRSIGEFNYKNENCRLIDHYKSDIIRHCTIENHPIKDVYVVQSSSGQTYPIGNYCINRIGNAKITEWFRNQQHKEDRLSNPETQNNLDIYAGFLNAIESDNLPFKPLSTQLEILKDGYNRVLNGKKLCHTHNETIINLVELLNKYFPDWKPKENHNNSSGNK